MRVLRRIPGKFVILNLLLIICQFIFILRAPLDKKYFETLIQDTWISDDEKVEKYLKNCIHTRYKHWVIYDTRIYFRSEPDVIGSDSIRPYAKRYHEPVFICRMFRIYRYDPETTPFGKQWMIFGFVDIYGKIKIRKNEPVKLII